MNDVIIFPHIPLYLNQKPSVMKVKAYVYPDLVTLTPNTKKFLKI